MKEKYLEPKVTLLGFIASQSLANGFDFDEDLGGGSSGGGNNDGNGPSAGILDEDLGFEW